jgi:predicted DNA-binding transcriptional regulator YafY
MQDVIFYQRATIAVASISYFTFMMITGDSMASSEIPRGERMVKIYAYLIRNRTHKYTVNEIQAWLERQSNEEVILRNVQRDLKVLAETPDTCVTCSRIDGKLKYFIEPDMVGSISLPIERNGLLAMFLLKRLQPFFASTAKNVEQLGSVLKEIGLRSQDDLFDDLDQRLEQDAFRMGESSVLNLDNDTLNNMLTALAERRKLEISYRRSAEGNPESRTICPVKLILYKSELYFACISEKHDYYIKLCRITSAALKEESFAVATDRLKRIESRLTRSFGILDDDESQLETVVLRFPAGWGLILSERRFHNSQKLSKDKKGNCILTMKAPVGKDLMQWVLGWSDSVVAVKPEKLRVMIRETAAGLVKEYAG